MKKKKLLRGIFISLSSVAALVLVAVIGFTIFSVVLNIHWRAFHQDAAKSFTASRGEDACLIYDGEDGVMSDQTLDYYFRFLLNSHTVPYGVGGSPDGPQIVLQLSDGATMTLTEINGDGRTHLLWQDEDGSQGFYLASQITFHQLSSAAQNCIRYDGN